MDQKNHFLTLKVFHLIQQLKDTNLKLLQKGKEYKGKVLKKLLKNEFY